MFTASFVHKERFEALLSYCILESCENILYGAIFACTCFTSRVISSLTVSDPLSLWVGVFSSFRNRGVSVIWSILSIPLFDLGWISQLHVWMLQRVLTLHLVKGDILSKHYFHFTNYWLRCFLFQSYCFQVYKYIRESARSARKSLWKQLFMPLFSTTYLKSDVTSFSCYVHVPVSFQVSCGVSVQCLTKLPWFYRIEYLGGSCIFQNYIPVSY